MDRFDARKAQKVMRMAETGTIGRTWCADSGNDRRENFIQIHG
jgi:hypothetical protein